MTRAVRVIGPRHAHVAVMPDGTLRYRYTVPGVGRCDFSTLAEVGEPWQPEFRALLTRVRREFQVERGAKLDRHPWIADRAVYAPGVQS